MAETAIGSVGDTTAANANATASGMAGTSQWMKRPMPTTVNTTSPRASPRIVLPSLNNSPRGMRQPTRNRSGGRNKKIGRAGGRERVRQYRRDTEGADKTK